MASVTSKALKDVVLEGMNRTGIDYMWLGGSDLEEEGAWKWADGSSWNDTFWAEKEPNNCCGGEGCLLQVLNYPRVESGTWHDWNCHNTARFLCTKQTCSGRKK